MMSATGVPRKYTKLFWREALQTATIPDSWIIFKVEGKKCPDSSIGLEKPLLVQINLGNGAKVRL
jgi:hypothetical protein